LALDSGSDGLSEVLEQFRSRLSGDAAKLIHLSGQLQSCETTIAEQQQALAVCQGESRSLKEALASREGFTAKLAEDAEGLRANNNELNQLLDRRSAQLADLERGFQDQILTIEALRQSQSAAACELQAASLERASLAVVAQKDATRMDELQQALFHSHTLAQTQTRLEAEIDRLTLEISAIQKESSDQISEITARASSLETQLYQKEEQLGEVERQCDNKAGEIRELSQRLAETTEECAELCAEITSQKASIQGFMQDLTACRSTILDLKDKHAKHIEAHDRVEGELRTYQSELPKIQSAILELRHGGTNQQFVVLADEIAKLLGESGTGRADPDESLLEEDGETVPVDVAQSALGYGQEQRMRVHQFLIAVLAGLALIFFIKPI
jgi:chromosome segregation ATPase